MWFSLVCFISVSILSRSITSILLFSGISSCSLLVHFPSLQLRSFSVVASGFGKQYEYRNTKDSVICVHMGCRGGKGIGPWDRWSQKKNFTSQKIFPKEEKIVIIDIKGP